ncbi:MAG: AlpA family transcriptional regulator [Maritimibacter sp.]|nr:AlpA family transcriptional regulator [Maritimibacter sp.]
MNSRNRLDGNPPQRARILRRPEIETLTGLSRSTIYAMMSEGTFPKPIRLGRRAVGWTESCIQEWIESRPSGME